VPIAVAFKMRVKDVFGAVLSDKSNGWTANRISKFKNGAFGVTRFKGFFNTDRGK